MGKKLLSTRPLGNASLQLAADQGAEITELSFISTSSLVNPKMAETIQALSQQPLQVILTSMNAVTAVSENIAPFSPAWNIYCIGHTTQQLVRECFPLSVIMGTGENALQLANVVAKEANKREVVFFCGNQRRDELPDYLTQQGFSVEELVVYQTNETPHALTAEYDGILFFSPSAVRSFFAVNQLPEKTVVFVIGNTTGAEVAKFSTNTIITTDAPGKDALLLKALSYWKLK